MKKNIHNPQALVLYEGYFSDHYYSSYEVMAQSINNWEQVCPYQLNPNGLSGRHQILQLHSMQIAYAQRKGGTMHNAVSSKDALAIAVVEVCAGKACFGHMKLQEGDILFFDDSRPYNFVTNDVIEFIVLTIDKSSLGERLPKLSKAIDHIIHDTDSSFTTALHKILKSFVVTSAKKRNMQIFQEIEEGLLAVIMNLLEEQTPIMPKLSPGEKIALTIRDQAFGHMDGKISITSLAKQHKVSEQTLQNSFKSLFGYTPKYFLRALKLNIVRQELYKSTPSQNKVSKIAFKWGFSHMGQFSHYYTELFGENPSQTLKNIKSNGEDSKTVCVARQEEMT